MSSDDNRKQSKVLILVPISKNKFEVKVQTRDNMFTGSTLDEGMEISLDSNGNIQIIYNI